MTRAPSGLKSAFPSDAGGRRAGFIDAEIGQRIRRLRNSKQLSQEELSARLGISCQQLQKYESGANRISASRLVQLADALAVEISLFLRDTPANDTAADPAAVTADHAGARQPVAALPNGAEVLALITSFCAISNPVSRAKVSEMASFLAGLEGGPARAGLPHGIPHG